jgi:uncharacterized membrane protein
MATMTVIIDVDETTKDTLTRAAADARQSLSEYLIEAASERMRRDAVAPYREILADHPDIAAALTAARQATLRSRAAVRAEVLAKYGVVAG